MRISTTSNVTPKSTPPSSDGSQGGVDEQLIWHSLVPRLVHPARLQIVEALIEKGSSMSIEELTSSVPLANGNAELVRYHAKAMTEAGALEVVDAAGKPTFFFSLSASRA